MKNQLKNIRKQPKTKMYAIFDSIDQTLWRAISNYELQQRLQRLQWLQWLQWQQKLQWLRSHCSFCSTTATETAI